MWNCNVFLWSKLNFQHHYSSSVSHDPSEITLIWWSRNIYDYHHISDENSCACKRSCNPLRCKNLFLKIWYLLTSYIGRRSEAKEVLLVIILVIPVTAHNYCSMQRNPSSLVTKLHIEENPLMAKEFPGCWKQCLHDYHKHSQLWI